jgi:drug/metabolite transporter (DMT)-like permease
VVYATLFAALLLHEWPTMGTVIGGTIIVSAAMYESFTAGGSQPKIRTKVSGK